ncbi:MAG TPA: hypothetical protein VF618_00965 [Thermoanaerobaculia bacterium]
MKKFGDFLLIAVMAGATPLLAQTPPKRIAVSIEKKGSACEHIDHARALMAHLSATRGEARHVAVANAAGHLGAVERTWPNDGAAIAEANVLLTRLYLDANMPHNAVEAATRALPRNPNDSRLHAASARAHERLGNKSEAAAAYTRFLSTFDARRAETSENVAALNAAAFFFEKEKQPARAADALRQAASLDDLSPTIRVTLLLRAIEQSALTADRQATGRTLAALRDAHRRALGTSLTPAQIELLKIAEAAIHRFEAQDK